MSTSRPANYPDWTQGLPTQVSDSSQARKLSGWSPGDRPTAQELNQRFYLLGQWTRFLDGNVKTALVSDNNQGGSFRLIGGGVWSYSASTGVLAWDAPFFITIPGLADSANQVAAGQITLSPGDVAYVLGNVPFAATGTTTANSSLVEALSVQTGVAVGQAVSGAGIPANTTVVNVSSTDNTLTLSNPATATATDVTLNFTSSGALTVKSSPVASLALSPNTLLIARSIAGTPSFVHVGVNAGQMILRDNERKGLLGQGYGQLTRYTAGVAMPANTAVYLSGASDTVSFLLDGGNVGDKTVPITRPPLTDNSGILATGGGAIINTGDKVRGAILPGDLLISPAAYFTQPTKVVSVTTDTVTLDTALKVSSASATLPLVFSRPAGRIFPCDPNERSRRGFVGFTQSAVALDASIPVVSSGQVQGFSSLAPSFPYYVSSSVPGTLTGSRPLQNGVVAGTAINGTTILVNPAPLHLAALGDGMAVHLGGYGNASAASGLYLTVEPIFNTAANSITGFRSMWVAPYRCSITSIALTFGAAGGPAPTQMTAQVYKNLPLSGGVNPSFAIADAAMVAQGQSTPGMTRYNRGELVIEAGDILTGGVYTNANGPLYCQVKITVDRLL